MKHTRRLTPVLLAVAATLLVFSAASAHTSSPFVGHWVAIDSSDGSDIRLTFGGGHLGPFNITWTESYFSFCGGQPGIFRGTGSSNEDNPNVLFSTMKLRCFTTGRSGEFNITFTHASDTNTITDGTDTWYRPGH